MILDEYANIRECKFPCKKVCNYADLQVCRYASRNVYKYAVLQLASIQDCEYENM